VPGHRDFIENMLAGVGGIDAALLVIAADEGVMPQTSEHLAILDLLQVNGGVIALTKVDLVEDEDWLELVTLDVSEVVQGTVLEDAPIIPVSARSREGLAELAVAIAQQLEQYPARRDTGRPRLPIDRVFSLSGFGTVVTGTLIDGTLNVGDTMEVQPGGMTTRIRGLQTHKQTITQAQPGSRVAVNLTGVSKGDLERGQVLTTPDWLTPTFLIDVSYRHLSGSDQPLKHNQEVKVFAGSAEVLARTRVLGAQNIAPGDEGWLQLRLSEPLALVNGDRFIIRRPSPGTTLGGGTVVDPAPRRRHRRFRPEIVERLITLSAGTPREILLQTLGHGKAATLGELAEQCKFEIAPAREIVEQLVAENAIIPLGATGKQQLFVYQSTWHDWVDRSKGLLKDYHSSNPLRLGMMKEELKSRLKLNANVFNQFLHHAGEERAVIDEGVVVRLPEHKVEFNPNQRKAVDLLIKQFSRDPFNTPSYKECVAAVGEQVYAVLLERGDLVQTSEDVVFDTRTIKLAEERVRSYIQQHGSITVGQARDLFGSSRKYILSLLEYFDQSRITQRKEDVRVLRR
ncbi:MAG: selenocysteine-specific translation elongation factor, partial [Chloroflexota bacterium]